MPQSRRRRSPSGTPKSPSRPPSASRSPQAEDSGEEGSASDKDHYDYQEMIDHLRKVRGATEQQGLKSKKKRRRRSHQPILKKRKRRNMGMLTFLLLILPILAFVGGSYLFSYMAYKGERFRKEMSARVGEATGLDGEFSEPFSVSRLAFKNRNYSAIGPNDSVLAEVDLTNIEAYLRATSLVGNRWDITRLIVDEGKLHLRPITPEPVTANSEAVGESDGLEVLAAKIGFSGAPDEFEMEKVSFRNLSASFGNNVEIIHNLFNMHMVMNRTQTGYFINCDRGTLEYFYWPVFKVISSDLFLDDSGILNVHRASLETEDGGTCDITGTINFGGPTPSVDLSIEVENIKVDSMVNEPTWGDRVLGLLSGELKLVGDLTTTNPPVLTGKVRIPELSVKNLEMLNDLEKFCGVSQLKRVEFESFEALIHQQGSTIRIHDIYGKNPSLVGLTGEFTVHPNHDLEGKLELGLPESTLLKVGGGRPEFFETRADDSPYGWASFTISGKLADPIDDLRRRFEMILDPHYDPREHRPMSNFRRPVPLIKSPEDFYLGRLNQLFDHLSQ